jgi:hypothetical protein
LSSVIRTPVIRPPLTVVPTSALIGTSRAWSAGVTTSSGGTADSPVGRLSGRLWAVHPTRTNGVAAMAKDNRFDRRLNSMLFPPVYGFPPPHFPHRRETSTQFPIMIRTAIMGGISGAACDGGNGAR